MSPSAADWVRRWDRQQEVYIRARESRYDVMLSFLELLAGPDPLVLDLAAGPGSTAVRVLERLPGARVVAVDTDPVLLRLGREAHGEHDGRLRWVRADLRDPSWPESLGVEAVDAVVSTTATHWLRPHELCRVYQQLADLMPHGVLVNGDLLPLSASAGRIAAAAREIDEQRQRDAAPAAESWDDWWASLRREPRFADDFAVRDGLWPGGTSGLVAPSLELHRAALHDAGFTEVDVVWQDLEERVVVAVR